MNQMFLISVYDLVFLLSYSSLVKFIFVISIPKMKNNIILYFSHYI